jgi:hypothetical protein
MGREKELVEAAAGPSDLSDGGIESTEYFTVQYSTRINFMRE